MQSIVETEMKSRTTTTATAMATATATDNSSRENENNSKSDSEDGVKFKRSFTLTRNPFSVINNKQKLKRKVKTKLSAENCIGSVEASNIGCGNDGSTSCGESDTPSCNNSRLKRLLSQMVQHFGAVSSVTNYYFPVNSANLTRASFFSQHSCGPGQVPGVIGLFNHGNTCFINAVLQCIAHTNPLTEYFVLDRYRVDLTRRNKLNSKKFGTKGEITEQLAILLKSLWSCQYKSEISACFKTLVEKYGPQYRGVQQHDAHEFLQWLIDKVHEDLNTASKKKYKSIKSLGRADEIVAAETLANHERCNNSFVQSVFQAQFRSSLTCSCCEMQSNTFDPFHCISVQLPQLSRQSIFVTVVYTSQQPRQVKIGLNLPSVSTVSELRDTLVSDTSITRSSILLTEIVDSGFVRTFNDSQLISTIAETSTIYCIEMAQLKDVPSDDSADINSYILLCWVNIMIKPNGEMKLFGSPYTMQVSRETNYNDLQKLLLKEMANILYDDVVTAYQKSGVFRIRVLDPIDQNGDEPPCYLDPDLEHPLFVEFVDQALALSLDDDAPPHLKLVLEWSENDKQKLIADDDDIIEEHESVKQFQIQSSNNDVTSNLARNTRYSLTLADCLKHYTKAETLAVEDAWRCPHCLQYLPVIKTLHLWTLPDILVIHLKRFRQQQSRGRSSTKLTTMVEFPVINLDMSEHLATRTSSIVNNRSSRRKLLKPTSANSNVDNIYDLYAVCYHHGSDLETGHYTATCKNSFDNQWYLFDDTKITNLGPTTSSISSKIVTNEAYILFYQKQSIGKTKQSSNSINSSTESYINSRESHLMSRFSKIYYSLNGSARKSEKIIQKTRIESKLDRKNENEKCAVEEHPNSICRNENESVSRGTSNDQAVLLAESNDQSSNFAKELRAFDTLDIESIDHSLTNSNEIDNNLHSGEVISK